MSATEAPPVSFPRQPLHQRQPLALDLKSAASALGVSYTHFRKWILPELRVVRSGRRYLVATSELERWLAANASLLLPEELPEP